VVGIEAKGSLDEDGLAEEHVGGVGELEDDRVVRCSGRVEARLIPCAQ